MKKLHAKSPCCGAPIQRFGQRRRRCAQCHGTWRVHKKKRGRKRKRVNHNLVISYLERNIPSLRAIAKRKGCSKDSIQVMLRRSLELYVKQKKEQWWLSLKNSGSLIAIVDAIWYHVREEFYTIYIILLRPIKSTQATICPPVIIQGREDFNGWEEAFNSLPDILKKRIIALVCDGATSLVALARLKRWILQRCHFHLIAAVQNYLTTGPRSAHRDYAFYVLDTVRELLRTNDPKKVQKMRRKLREIRQASNSRGIRRVLGGLIKSYKDYRAYLNYPELNLPTTSNSAESFIQCVRDLMYRCRGFRSYTTLNNWLTALSLSKKTIRCNGKNQPN